VAAPTFTGFWIQEWPAHQPTYYVDDVVMTRSVPIIPPPPLDHGMALYGDRFSEGWDNWSWARTVDRGNARPVNSGTSSIAVRARAVHRALDDFHHAAGGHDQLRQPSRSGSTSAARAGQVLTLHALLSGTPTAQSFALAG